MKFISEQLFETGIQYYEKTDLEGLNKSTAN